MLQIEFICHSFVLMDWTFWRPTATIVLAELYSVRSCTLLSAYSYVTVVCCIENSTVESVADDCDSNKRPNCLPRCLVQEQLDLVQFDNITVEILIYLWLFTDKPLRLYIAPNSTNIRSYRGISQDIRTLSYKPSLKVRESRIGLCGSFTDIRIKVLYWNFHPCSYHSIETLSEHCWHMMKGWLHYARRRKLEFLIKL